MNKALQKSIEHWERIVSLAQAQDDPGLVAEGWHGDECALCNQYAEEWNCGQCPVALHSGVGHCINTPWDDACASLSYVTTCEAEPEDWAHAIDKTKVELEFLRSLE